MSPGLSGAFLFVAEVLLRLLFIAIISVFKAVYFIDCLPSYSNG